MIGYLILFLAIYIIDRANEPLGKKYFYAFWVISVFSGIRYGIGYDYFSYYESMQDPNYETEVIPKFFMSIGRETHYSIFYILTSCFINFFFIRGMCIRKCPFETVYFYLGYPLLFVIGLSTIRQHMAVSVIFYLICLHSINKTKIILLIMLAYLCHRSSLICLLLLFPIERFLSKKSLLCLFFSSFILGEVVVNYLLSFSTDFTLLAKFLGFLGEDMAGGQIKKIVVYFTIIVVILNYNKLYSNGVDKRYLNYTIVGGCLFALFSTNTHVAERFCVFFLSSILLFVVKLCQMRQVPLFEYKFICVLLFVSSIYIGHITSSQEGVYAKYKASLFYPYETIFGNAPDK